MAKTGRPRTCECGTCARCLHREYQRNWYQGKTLDERRAMIAGRNPETVRRAERNRYRRRKGSPINVANYTLNNAIRDGRIQRGPCEICGATEKVHGHHDDYSKPLDVRWLCEQDHLLWHALLQPVTGAAS